MEEGTLEKGERGLKMGERKGDGGIVTALRQYPAQSSIDTGYRGCVESLEGGKECPRMCSTLDDVLLNSLKSRSLVARDLFQHTIRVNEPIWRSTRS